MVLYQWLVVINVIQQAFNHFTLQLHTERENKHSSFILNIWLWLDENCEGWSDNVDMSNTAHGYSKIKKMMDYFCMKFTVRDTIRQLNLYCINEHLTGIEKELNYWRHMPWIPPWQQGQTYCGITVLYSLVATLHYYVMTFMSWAHHTAVRMLYVFHAMEPAASPQGYMGEA